MRYPQIAFNFCSLIFSQRSTSSTTRKSELLQQLLRGSFLYINIPPSWYIVSSVPSFSNSSCTLMTRSYKPSSAMFRFSAFVYLSLLQTWSYIPQFCIAKVDKDNELYYTWDYNHKRLGIKLSETTMDKSMERIVVLPMYWCHVHTQVY